MGMRQILLPVAICLIAAPVYAAENCGLRVVKLLAAGNAAEVPRLFVREEPSTLFKLKQIVAVAGEISVIAQAQGPRFSESRQYKVDAPGLPQSYGSINYRVNASSALHGPIQFTVATALDSECKILSIQLEVDAKTKVSSLERPNHSFNRKQWGMPSFGPPFHYGPNAVIPHCSG